jgi:hypothetical protein
LTAEPGNADERVLVGIDRTSPKETSMAEREGGSRFPTRCLHAALDAEAYSGRTSLRQRDLQQRIEQALFRAAEAIGFAPQSLWLQPQGDGGLLRFPAGIDEAATMAGLIRELRTELVAVNRDLVPDARVRLRLAFHVGLSQDARLGLAGEAPVSVSRLVNSSALRARLSEAVDASLVVIIPDALFQDLVVHRLRGLDPDEWDPTRVTDRAKKFDCAAWMTTPGSGPRAESGGDRGNGGHGGRERGDERVDNSDRTGPAGSQVPRTDPTLPPDRPQAPLVGIAESVGKISVFNGPVHVAHGGFTIN